MSSYFLRLRRILKIRASRSLKEATGRTSGRPFSISGRTSFLKSTPKTLRTDLWMKRKIFGVVYRLFQAFSTVPQPAVRLNFTAQWIRLNLQISWSTSLLRWKTKKATSTLKRRRTPFYPKLKNILRKHPLKKSGLCWSPMESSWCQEMRKMPKIPKWQLSRNTWPIRLIRLSKMLWATPQSRKALPVTWTGKTRCPRGTKHRGLNYLKKSQIWWETKYLKLR